MGGKVFSATHCTPRMPPEIYHQVLSTTKTLLRKHFQLVDSPIEAPGKYSYGDIDVLAFGPLDPSFDNAVAPRANENISKILGAAKWAGNRNAPNVNYAIPWPHDDEEESEKKHIQVDVQICKTEKQMQWKLFHTAHGDLWNILGSTIRQFGLTVNDKGMHLRIPDIEAFDKKKALVFLTDDPKRLLEFIGLDAQRWFERFASQQELFDYASGCRLFWVKPIKEEGEAEGDVIVDERDIEGQEGGAEGKKKLKHNDRQRMNKRPIFRDWMEVYIPKLREEGRFTNTEITRDEIRDDAFRVFGVQEEFETIRAAWVLSKHIDDVWAKIIKAGVPQDLEPQLRSATIKLLKSVVLEGGEFEGVVPRAAERDDDGFFDVKEVSKFVRDNWERAGYIGLERQKARADEAMRTKKEKKALEETTKLEQESKRRRTVDETVRA